VIPESWDRAPHLGSLLHGKSASLPLSLPLPLLVLALSERRKERKRKEGRKGRRKERKTNNVFKRENQNFYLGKTQN